MTKSEAISYLTSTNEKITHRYFTDEEFIQRSPDGKSYIDENGYILDPVEFWSYRRDPCFDDGWSIKSN